MDPEVFGLLQRWIAGDHLREHMYEYLKMLLQLNSPISALRELGYPDAAAEAMFGIAQDAVRTLERANAASTHARAMSIMIALGCMQLLQKAQMRDLVSTLEREEKRRAEVEAAGSEDPREQWGTQRPLKFARQKHQAGVHFKPEKEAFEPLTNKRLRGT